MYQTHKTRDYLIQALILYTVHRTSKRVYFDGVMPEAISQAFLEHEVVWTDQPTATYDTVILFRPTGSDEAILHRVRQARLLLAEGANLIVFGREIKGLLEEEAALVESVPTGEHLYVMADHITPDNLKDKVIWIKMKHELNLSEAPTDARLEPMAASQLDQLAGCYLAAFEASEPGEDLTMASSKDYIREALSSQEQPWIKSASLVAMKESELMAAVIVTRFEGSPLINQLITLPKYWRQGLGRSLLKGAIHQLKLEGESELILYVLLRNTAAKALYESLGFYEIGRGIA